MNQQAWSKGTHSAHAPVMTAVCVQLCATVMLRYGYTTDENFNLTNLGRWLGRPEREISLFVTGCALALIAGVIASVIGERMLARRPLSPEDRDAISRTLLFLSIGSFALYVPLAYDQLFQLTSVSPDHLYDLVPFLLPSAMLVGLSLLETMKGPTARSKISTLLHGFFPYLFIVLLFPRDWHALSGKYFYSDDMLHHINFFVVTPYVNVAHGKILAIEAFSQYGLGWPTFFNYMLSPESASYTIFFLSFILATILYLGIFYGLLRMLTGHYALAATGLLLWYFLLSMKFGEPFWGGPQALPARYPFDALILICTYQFLRTKQPRYSFALSALLAAALFWITDTGIFILVAVNFMIAIRLVNDVRDRSLDWITFRRSSITNLATGSLVFLVLVFVAVQGAIVSPAFWSGWLSGVNDSRGGLGYGSIPMESTGFGGLLLFCLLMFFYLQPVIRAGHRALNGTLSNRDAFFALVGVYGLELMLAYVSQSRETNAIQKYMHPAIILALAYYAQGWRMKRFRLSPLKRLSLDLVALTLPLAIAVYAAFTVSGDQGIIPPYDDLWEAQNVYRGPATYSHQAKIEYRGLPESSLQDVADVDRLFERAHELPDNESIAVLAQLDGALHLATNTQPTLDRPYLSSVFTVSARRAALEKIFEEKPRLVLLRVGPLPHFSDKLIASLQDSSDYFHDELGARYTLKEIIGAFEVWELSAAE